MHTWLAISTHVGLQPFLVLNKSFLVKKPLVDIQLTLEILSCTLIRIEPLFLMGVCHPSGVCVKTNKQRKQTGGWEIDSREGQGKRFGNQERGHVLEVERVGHGL